MNGKQKNASLSENVVGYLLRQGMTQAQMTRILEVSRSYISRAVSGERDLSVEHMTRLAEAVDMILPELLARAMSPDSVPPRLRPSYRLLLRGLKRSAETRKAMAKRPTLHRAAVRM